MVNEEILTALKNAVEHGEDLNEAVNVLINSGYNSREVQEASHFINSGYLGLEPKPDEHFVMPNQKTIFPQNPNFSQKLNQESQLIKHEISKDFISNIKKDIPSELINSDLANQPIKNESNEPLTNQLERIKPPRRAYLKEIILIIILLILIGVLIATFIFKSTILSWFG